MPEPDVDRFPIEITTHNIYFHEDSPVLSIDIHDLTLATCGFDGTVRLWKLVYGGMDYAESVYRTATNSTIRIEYIKDLVGLHKPINCIRFCRSITQYSYVLAACSDGGKVMIFTDQGAVTVQCDIGDDAYDMCWDGNRLFVGFGSGAVGCYEIHVDALEQEEPSPDEVISEKYKLSSKMIFIQNVHEGTVQGIAYSGKYSLLATFSLDKSVKVHLVGEDGLKLISTLEERIDNSRGLFKRILFDEDCLYVFTKNSCLSVFLYPFRQADLQRKIGPLNSSIVKVLKGKIQNEDVLIICTKKSVCVMKNDRQVYHVDNACYMAITDAVFSNDTLFLSSMDGFVCSIRHKCG